MVAGDCVAAIGGVALAVIIANCCNPVGWGAALAIGIGVAYSVTSTLVSNYFSTRWENEHKRNWGIE